MLRRVADVMLQRYVMMLCYNVSYICVWEFVPGDIYYYLCLVYVRQYEVTCVFD
jgi:hypothetical protein